MRICMLAGASALALSVTQTRVSAQTTAPTQTAQADAPQSWVSEVVVTGSRGGYATPDASTATRTTTPLIDVPQSVEVITRSLIQEQDVHTLADALVNVSGVTPERPEEALFTTPIIHGFPAEIYLDGLPQFTTNEAGNDPTSLVGVDRIEVVKGPTSTLYGGGLGSPLGGVINVVSERPTLGEFAGYAALRGGSFATVDPYGDVNLPLGPSIAARVAAEYQSNGGWIDKINDDRWSMQPSLLFQLNPTTDLVMRAQLFHRGELEYSGLPAPQALAGQIDRDAFPGSPIGQPRTTVDNRLATAELHHAFSNALRLTVTGRFSESDTQEYGSFVDPDIDAPDPSMPTAYPVLPIHLTDRAHEATLDANLADTFTLLGGRHELLGGIDYDRTNFVSDLAFAGTSVSVLDLAKPSYTSAYGGVGPINDTETDHFQTIALYLQDQATYGRLHLTGSVRYTEIHFQEREFGTDQTYYHVSPRIGATLDLVQGVALYGGYETAFRTAFAFMGLTPPKPEESTNYEAGLKLALTRFGLSGTVSAFHQTQDNIPTADPANPFLSIQTGEQRAQGLETDLIWEPTPAVSILANYAYTDSAVTRDPNIPEGQALARVPRNSGRIAARYRVLDGPVRGLSFGAGVTAFDSRQLTLPNTVSVPGYAAVDAQAAYAWGRYTVQVSAVNLAGRRAFDPYEYLGYPVVEPNPPRSAYVTVKASF